MHKDETELRAEGKRAINEVVSAYMGVAALNLRREIRKSFPFGPGADARTKEIWNELVDDAIKSVKTITVVALVVLFACSPALAADRKVSDGHVWYSVAEENLTPIEYGKKIPFSIRHPKQHKFWRGVRKKCQSLKPILDVGADIWVFIKDGF